ncbi:MAG TPA: hypothetical protein VK217_06885, partial [Acidimicrobiales bacterium]|nr:hypothetical protein [Acidimicrobiales bacterium]
MSDETEEGELEDLELEAPPAGAADAGGSGLEEVRNDLFAAIEELGLASADAEEEGSVAAGCYLSNVPSDRHGHGGVVVRWLLPDAVAEESDTSGPLDPVDILNEALGPLLLALGFPIEPYAVDGRWIVTGRRS